MLRNKVKYEVVIQKNEDTNNDEVMMAITVGESTELITFAEVNDLLINLSSLRRQMEDIRMEATLKRYDELVGI